MMAQMWPCCINQERYALYCAKKKKKSPFAALASITALVQHIYTMMKKKKKRNKNASNLPHNFLALKWKLCSISECWRQCVWKKNGVYIGNPILLRTSRCSAICANATVDITCWSVLEQEQVRAHFPVLQCWQRWRIWRNSREGKVSSSRLHCQAAPSPHLWYFLCVAEQSCACADYCCIMLHGFMVPSLRNGAN